MKALAGSGHSAEPTTTTAAEAASRQALAALEGAPPTAGFVFASPRHRLPAVISVVKRLAPSADVMGCTTAGEITERGLTKGGIALMLLAGDEMLHETAFATGVKTDPDGAAARLCASFHQRAREGKTRALWSSTSVVLVDGLAGSGERLVQGILREARTYQQVVGGAAGDDSAFKTTHVGAGKRCSADAAAAMHFFGSRRWGVGVDHGLEPTTFRHRVTRASGNIIHEIDDKPAFELYREHARARGVTLDPANAGPYLINNEIGVYFLDELRTARAPLSVSRDGALVCAADIAEGSAICILDGKADAMVAAAHRAALEARAGLEGAEACGVLLFDCVCRGTILGDDMSREIAAVSGVFPEVPLAGFLTYGEIARFKGRLDGWHNTTAVVVAIPA